MAEQQLDLTTWLSELEADRAKVDLMIAEVRRRLGQPPSEGGVALPQLPALGGGQPTAPPQSGRIRQDEFFRMSIPDAIKKYLNIMKQPQSPKAIEEGLKSGGLLTNSKHFYSTLFTALKRLHATDEVVNTANGWGLSEWYPSRPRGPDETPKKNGKGKPAKPPKQRGEAQPTKPSPYRQFMGEQLKAGKTMSEAAQEWRKQHRENHSANGATVKALLDR